MQPSICDSIDSNGQVLINQSNRGDIMYKVNCEDFETFMRTVTLAVQAGLHFEADASRLVIEFNGGY